MCCLLSLPALMFGTFPQLQTLSRNWAGERRFSSGAVNGGSNGQFDGLFQLGVGSIGKKEGVCDRHIGLDAMPFEAFAIYQDIVDGEVEERTIREEETTTGHHGSCGGLTYQSSKMLLLDRARHDLLTAAGSSIDEDEQR